MPVWIEWTVASILTHSLFLYLHVLRGKAAVSSPTRIDLSDLPLIHTPCVFDNLMSALFDGWVIRDYRLVF